MRNIPHPNLYCNRQELDAYREKCLQDEKTRKTYEAFTASAGELLLKPLLTEEYANAVYSQHGNYTAVGSQLGEFARVLGWKYAIEKDAACADRLKEALLYVSGFRIWTGPENPDKNPAWHSGLETTAISLAFALGYDLLYDYLTQEERERIAGALIEKGIRPLMEDWVLPGSRIHCLDSMGHNWWAACISMAGVCLLPVADLVPEADAWFALIDEALYGFVDYPGAKLLPKRPNFDEQGLFYESIGYFCYGTGEALTYIYHRERYTKKPCGCRHPLFAKMAEAMMSFAYPTDEGLWFLNFGDSSTEVDVRHFMKYLILCGYDSTLCYPCFARGCAYEDLTDLLLEERFLRQGDLSGLPKTRVFPDTGYVISRSSWEKNAILFAIKSGYTWNHTHEDAGSFILWAAGKQLIIDSGTVNSYSHPKYHGYYMRAIAHNVVMFDGKNQDEMNIHRGIRFMGIIPYVEEAIPGVQYICMEVTGPTAQFCGRNFRNVVIIDHRYFVIVDDIYTYDECEAEALFHYGGTGALTEKGLQIRQDGVQAILQPVFPEHAGIAFHAGHIELEEEKDAVFAGVSTKKKQKQHLLINVISLGEAKAARIAGFESEGVSIGDTQIYFNRRADGSRMHKNSNNVLGGAETDAYMIIQRGTYVQYVFASYLRIDGVSYFDSFQKQNGSVMKRSME